VKRFVVLVVDAAPTAAGVPDEQTRSLGADLRDISDGMTEIAVVPDAAAALRVADEVMAGGGFIPVVFVDLDLDGSPDVERVVQLHDAPALRRSRFVIVTSGASLQGVDRALQAGAIQGMLSSPWTRHALERLAVSSLVTYLVEHAPDELEQFESRFEPAERERAQERVEQARRASPATPESTHLLLDASITDEAVEDRMIQLLDDALGHPPRLRVAPGTVLIEEGEDVGGIYVIREGVVRLSSSGQKVLHERSTGAIVGLLSLAQHRRAMLQCTAVTEVRAIPVTLGQLGRALDVNPEIGNLLTRVLITSLARRLRRSDELQLELDRSLAALAEARAQLVSQAKFATLGEMAAGLAHELNNPTAALVRVLEHLGDDVPGLIDDPALADEFDAQWVSIPPSPAETRSRRRALTEALGDRHLAERLVAIGVSTPEEARRVIAGGLLDRTEVAARVVDGLRAGQGAVAQIASLVDSLRSYARGDDGRGLLAEGVDVWEGIDAAVRLLSHRLGDVQVDTEGAEVPPVRARSGALQQVWTNLLTNALDVSSPGDVIRVHVDQPDSRHIRVSVADQGAGISPEHLGRIFEPRFTTKDGRVQFNLGLGLSISRQIVLDHGGTIDVESEPGRTVFTVQLPIGGPE